MIRPFELVFAPHAQDLRDINNKYNNMTTKQKTYKKAINILRNNIPGFAKSSCMASRSGLRANPSTKSRFKMLMAVSYISTRGFLRVAPVSK